MGQSSVPVISLRAADGEHRQDTVLDCLSRKTRFMKHHCPKLQPQHEDIRAATTVQSIFTSNLSPSDKSFLLEGDCGWSLSNFCKFGTSLSSYAADTRVYMNGYLKKERSDVCCFIST